MSSSGCLSRPARWTCDVPGGHGLSALRRLDRHPDAVRWLDYQRTVDLHLSMVTTAEVERDIAQQCRRNPAFAEELGHWLDRVLGWCGDRILTFTLSWHSAGGQLSAELGHGGAGLPITASAVEHCMMLVTGNARYFEPADVQVLNPFGGRGTNPA